MAPFPPVDNDASLGYPGMGKCSGLFLAEGNYNIGEPVIIGTGGQSIDPNIPALLPVATYPDTDTRTILMACQLTV